MKGIFVAVSLFMVGCAPKPSEKFLGVVTDANVKYSLDAQGNTVAVESIVETLNYKVILEGETVVTVGDSVWVSMKDDSEWLRCSSLDELGIVKSVVEKMFEDVLPDDTTDNPDSSEDLDSELGT